MRIILLIQIDYLFLGIPVENFGRQTGNESHYGQIIDSNTDAVMLPKKGNSAHSFGNFITRRSADSLARKNNLSLKVKHRVGTLALRLILRKEIK